MSTYLVFIACLVLRQSHGIERFGTPEGLINKTNCQYDYIVVGAGAGGCRITEKLLSLGSVLLIEAGGEPADASKNSSLWKYPFVTDNRTHLASDPEQRFILGGKLVGGSSSFNCIGYQRGNLRNYNLWAENYQLGYDWSWDEVLKSYIGDEANDDPSLANATHGRNGPLPITTYKLQDESGRDALRKAAKDEGIDWNDTQDGDDYNRAYLIQTHRQSICSAFLKSVSTDKLHVLLNGQVSKVIFDQKANSKPKAVGVDILLDDPSGKQLTCSARKEIILSAGALSTPKILLLSGIGDVRDLRKLNISVIYNNPEVGKNLRNHPGLGGIYLVGAKDSLVPETGQSCNDPEPEVFMNSTDGSYITNNAFGNVYMRSIPDYYHPYADIEVLFEGSRKSSQLGNGFSSRFDDYFKGISAQGNVVSVSVYHQEPKSRGWVKLRSANPRDYLETNFNYFSDPSDIDVLVAGAMRAVRLVNTSYFQSINITLNKTPFPACAQEEIHTAKYFTCLATQATLTNQFYFGTARMDGVAGRGVVNPRCQVWGVDNLRIADASVMPMAPTGHTMAPSYLIGARCGDFIRKDAARAQNRQS